MLKSYLQYLGSFRKLVGNFRPFDPIETSFFIVLSAFFSELASQPTVELSKYLLSGKFNKDIDRVFTDLLLQTGTLDSCTVSNSNKQNQVKLLKESIFNIFFEKNLLTR